MQEERKKIALLLICTNKYFIYLMQLLQSAEEFFFKDDDVTVYLFSDRHHAIKKGRFNIVQIKIDALKFPYATLYRYRTFITANDAIIKNDFAFYCDVDMTFVADVGREILPDGFNDDGLTATLHPGFYKGGGAWYTNHHSTAYVLVQNKQKYFAGGFQGGIAKKYMEACYIMDKNIADDEAKGIIAEWHDESHWNYLLSLNKCKVLDPAYCYVDDFEKVLDYGLKDIKPRLVALTKKHEDVRR